MSVGADAVVMTYIVCAMMVDMLFAIVVVVMSVALVVVMFFVVVMAMVMICHVQLENRSVGVAVLVVVRWGVLGKKNEKHSCFHSTHRHTYTHAHTRTHAPSL